MHKNYYNGYQALIDIVSDGDMELIGLASSEIEKYEGELCTRFPKALRDFYLSVGGQEALTQNHNRVYHPKNVRIEDGHLVFAEENQCVMIWGIRLEDLGQDDPAVYQLQPGSEYCWFKEDWYLYEFLIDMYCWIFEVEDSKTRLLQEIDND